MMDGYFDVECAFCNRMLCSGSGDLVAGQLFYCGSYCIDAAALRAAVPVVGTVVDPLSGRVLSVSDPAAKQLGDSLDES